MTLVLPNPSSPTNGQALDATPILQNETAIVNAINSFDGSQIQAGTVGAGAMAPSVNPNTLLYDTVAPFVASGCTWAITGGLVGNMSAGVAYVANTGSKLLYRVSVGSVASNTFTASKDTYIDVDYNGNIYYQAVSNGASAPAITANSLRLAIVVTDGSSITSVVQPQTGLVTTPVVGFVATSESTSSGSYGDLATVGPQVIARVGPSGKLKILIDSYMYNSGTNFNSISFLMEFDNTHTPTDGDGPRFKAANSANDQIYAYARTFTGLNPGIVRITLKYATTAGTFTAASRALTTTTY